MSAATPIEALRASLEQLCTILQGVETRLATVERHQQDLIRKSDELLSHKIAIPPPRDVPRDETLPKVSPPPSAPAPAPQKEKEEEESEAAEAEEGEEDEGKEDATGETREEAPELPFNHSSLLTAFEAKFEKTAKPELFEHEDCLYLKVWSHDMKCHLAYYPYVKGDLITAVDFTRPPIGVINDDDELEALPAPKPQSAAKAEKAPKSAASGGVKK